MPSFAQMAQGTVALVCFLRGLLVLPCSYEFSERIWTIDVAASLIWIAAGLAHLVGIMISSRSECSKAEVPSDTQASSV